MDKKQLKYKWLGFFSQPLQYLPKDLNLVKKVKITIQIITCTKRNNILKAAKFNETNRQKTFELCLLAFCDSTVVVYYNNQTGAWLNV